MSKPTRTHRARRSAPRKNLAPLTVESIASLENFAKVTKGGHLVEASTSGFLVIVTRDHLVPVEFRRNLNLDALVGTKVLVRIEELNLEISGRVARTAFRGKKGFEIGIDYSDDAPEYWRQCLVDLLPSPGEIDEN